MAFSDVIAALERAGCDPQVYGDKAKTRCPVHRGKGRSAKVEILSGGAIGWKCWAKGCSVADARDVLELQKSDFFENPRPAPIARRGRRRTRTKGKTSMGKGKKSLGFDKPTLAQMAKKSGTSVKFLEGLGWTEGKHEIHREDGTSYQGTGVRIPYYQKAKEGVVVENLVKVRLSLEGGPKYVPEHAPAKLALYGEWLLDEFKKRDKPFLILVEGETCTAAQLSQELPANGIPGVDTVAKVLRADHLEGFSRLFIVRESGAGGETFCANLAKHLPAIGWTGPVTVVALPDGQDSAEMLCELQEGFKDVFRSACEAGISLDRIATQSKAARMIKWANTVKMRPVRFLLYPYLPIGHLTLLAGEAGLGKSTGVGAIGAGISRGWPIGGASEVGELGNRRVLIFTGGEDSAEETTVPRYLAAGGDPEKLAVVDEKVSFENLELIGEVVSAVKPSLIVFDPLLRFWPPGLSMNDQETAGPMFEALSDLAGEHDAALMCVLWPPKGKPESASGAFFGSNAIYGTARSALLVRAADDDDPANKIRRGIFLHAKCNLAPLGDSFKYELSAEAVEIAEDSERFNALEAEALRRVGSFRWLGVVPETAEQVVSRGFRGGDEGRALAHASKLIREALEGGEQPFEVLADLQRHHGIPFQTYFMARLDVGVVQRTDQQGRVLVSLPGGGAEGDGELEQLVF